MNPIFSSAQPSASQEEAQNLPTPLYEWVEHSDAAGSGVSDQDLAVVARTLKGEALESLITESTRLGDVRMLRALKAAGHFLPFLLPGNGLEGSNGASVLGLSSQFQSLFRILGEGVSVRTSWTVAQRQRQSVFTTSGVTDPLVFRAGVRRLRLSSGVKGFLRELCAETVQAIGEQHAHSTQKGSEMPLKSRALVTLNALGCLACALDDVTMLDDVLASPLMRGPADAVMMDSFDYVRCGEEDLVLSSNLKMGGYAALFNSPGAFERLLDWDPNLLEEGMGQCVPSDRNQSGVSRQTRQPMGLSDLWQYADNLIPTPEFALVVAKDLMSRMGRDENFKNAACADPFRLSSGSSAKSPKEGRQPGIGVLERLLQYSVINTWPHLIAVCHQAGLYRINPTESIRMASMYSIKPLLEALREDFRFDLYGPSNEGTWFKETHPIWGLLSKSPRRGGTTADREECLTVVLREMDKKSVLLEQLSFADDSGVTCAGHLVANGLAQSVAYVLSRGACLENFMGDVKKKLTLEQLAIASGHEHLNAMIRSSAAKRVADDALTDIGKGAKP